MWKTFGEMTHCFWKGLVFSVLHGAGAMKITHCGPSMPSSCQVPGHRPDMVGVCAQLKFFQWRQVSKCDTKGSVVSCSDYCGERTGASKQVRKYSEKASRGGGPRYRVMIWRKVKELIWGTVTTGTRTAQYRRYKWSFQSTGGHTLSWPLPGCPRYFYLPRFPHLQTGTAIVILKIRLNNRGCMSSD